MFLQWVLATAELQSDLVAVAPGVVEVLHPAFDVVPVRAIRDPLYIDR